MRGSTCRLCNTYGKSSDEESYELCDLPKNCLRWGRASIEVGLRHCSSLFMNFLEEFFSETQRQAKEPGSNSPGTSVDPLSP